MNDKGASPSAPRPQRLKKEEAREALPEHLRLVFDKLCEEKNRCRNIITDRA